jgi:AcrR family transcriptional regulator
MLYPKTEQKGERRLPKLVDKTSTPKAEKVKRELAETAYRLFKEKGYDNVGIRDIAAACGVTTGAFYYHFKKKSDILNFHGDQNEVWLRRDIPQLLEKEDPLDKIRLLLSKYLCSIFEGEGWELCEDRMFVRHYGKRESPVLLELLSGMVGEALSAGDLSHGTAEEITQALLVAYRGVEYDWCVHHGSYQIGPKVRQHIDMVIDFYKSK